METVFFAVKHAQTPDVQGFSEGFPHCTNVRSV
ncbi:hypothetical protein AWB83_04601 [Caballeronia ptereochthonis]|uniref:Uncharacterized protein n=1 Tax=Caballeronia ptereochthonis TaxID=1777144 RepID=A0A158CRI9_9BURK|nr:hypothetical protein AWB83_04601 [Caballeronia ptereochthonis]